MESTEPILKFNEGRGFPKAKRRDVNLSSNSGVGSIFSRHFKKQKIEPMQTDSLQNVTIKEKIQIGDQIMNHPTQSCLITDDEKQQIHLENLSKLQSLPQSDILEEKERLLATLDPAIITYLKARRSKQQAPQDNRNQSIQTQNQIAEDMKIEEFEAPQQLLNEPNSDKWLNFNIIESNKLAWMKGIDVPKLDQNQAYEARFDFEGWLMPFIENQITEKSRILYHHGEDTGRPGYTLQELFQLSRYVCQH